MIAMLPGINDPWYGPNNSVIKMQINIDGKIVHRWRHTDIIILNQWKVIGLTRFAFGRQSKIENTSFALPSGSSGKNTPIASTSIWYKQLENTGSGSSLKYSLSRPIT